jgi:DNA sulfur modification protein DndB
MKEEKDGLTFRATQGTQGGRPFVTTTMLLEAFAETFHVDAEEIALELDAYRLVDEAHANDISEYVFEDGWVLPGIVIAVDTPWVWSPVKDGSGNVIDKELGYATLPLSARKLIRDGVHRAIGVRRGVRKDVDGTLDGDSLTLTIYLEPNADRRRQMLTDINFNAKAVTRSKSISFDTRSPFSVAINKHLIEHKMLKDRVETESSRVGKYSERVFTLSAVRDAIERVMGSPKVSPPIDDVRAAGTKFLNMLYEARTEYQQMAADATIIPNLRRSSLLASSTTLRVIATAVARARKDGSTDAEIAERLSKVSFDPADTLWTSCGFVVPGKTTPSSRTQEMAAAATALHKVLAA